MSEILIRETWHKVVEDQESVVAAVKSGVAVGSHNMILLHVWNHTNTAFESKNVKVPVWFNAAAITAVLP